MPTDIEREAITSHLLEYGDDCGFTPLAARDYGSRARGLESASSDYDVLFVFAQPPATYATGGATETYTKKISADDSRLNTEIELHGWNLRRFIGSDGLLGSNPTAIEFCASEEQYFIDEHIEPYMASMTEHATNRFKPYALINHYRSLAASNYGKYIEGDYKLASDATYGDLLDHADVPTENVIDSVTNKIEVDEQMTEFRDDGIDLWGHLNWAFPIEFIDSDQALDAGLIEPTTTDRTVKRHLNISQALLKARLIEETHEVPDMQASELLRTAAGTDWLPKQVYADIGELIVKKKAGNGSNTIDPDGDLHDWIESELSRSITAEGHVERQPSTDYIRNDARACYEAISFGSDAAD